MTPQQFTYNSRHLCPHYTTPCNGELVWCNHTDNQCNTEGNCTLQDCPALSELKTLAIEELFGNTNSPSTYAPR